MKQITKQDILDFANKNLKFVPKTIGYSLSTANWYYTCRKETVDQLLSVFEEDTPISFEQLTYFQKTWNKLCFDSVKSDWSHDDKSDVFITEETNEFLQMVYRYFLTDLVKGYDIFTIKLLQESGILNEAEIIQNDISVIGGNTSNYRFIMVDKNKEHLIKRWFFSNYQNCQVYYTASNKNGFNYSIPEGWYNLKFTVLSDIPNDTLMYHDTCDMFVSANLKHVKCYFEYLHKDNIGKRSHNRRLANCTEKRINTLKEVLTNKIISDINLYCIQKDFKKQRSFKNLCNFVNNLVGIKTKCTNAIDIMDSINAQYTYLTEGRHDYEQVSVLELMMYKVVALYLKDILFAMK